MRKDDKTERDVQTQTHVLRPDRLSRVVPAPRPAAEGPSLETQDDQESLPDIDEVDPDVDDIALDPTPVSGIRPVTDEVIESATLAVTVRCPV